MLAYRRPSWVRGELYDGVGTLRASFLLDRDDLSVQLSGNGEVIRDEPAWDGWDDVLGLPQGSSRLFDLLPALIDPWATVGSEPVPPSGTLTAMWGGSSVEISFSGGRPERMDVGPSDSRVAECSFEGGDGCLAAERYTIDLVDSGVVVWITVEADADFPKALNTDAPLGN